MLDFLVILLFCLAYFYFYFFPSPMATLMRYFSLDYSLCVCVHLFSARILLVSTSFNNLLTLPHVPTTPKASLFMLASEHLGCISGF